MPLLQTIKTLVSRLEHREATADSANTILVQRDGPITEQTHSTPAIDNVNTTDVDVPLPADVNANSVLQVIGELRSSSGFISNSRDILIRDSTMINVESLIQNLDHGRTALHLLEQKRAAGAEVDSSARHYPPKCHPETRQSARCRITDWLTNSHRNWGMLWLLGPAGVGKSAIAQTIAEECKDAGTLGATFFFSRLNRRDNPLTVLPTIAYQLAIFRPDYRQIVTQRLADDPTILEKNLRTQFRELIAEPFKTLLALKPSIAQQPLLIVIDGLDECNSSEAQCQFIDLISAHVGAPGAFPLLWMVCSRPEWHLKGIFSSPDFHVNCAREELLVDDAEAQEDVHHVLLDGFAKIRRKFWDIFDGDEQWPAQTEVRQISRISSGLFVFADTILRFVGDPEKGDPVTQLKICLRFMDNLSLPGAVNPLHTLDLLYRRILLDIPAHILPTTMRILGFSILYSSHPLTAWELSNFLCLSRGAFYAALQKLHSVLQIPIPPHCYVDKISFHHASFGDFLKNSHRSGQLTLDFAKIQYDVTIHCLRWTNSLMTNNCIQSEKIRCYTSPMDLCWDSEPVQMSFGLHSIYAFAKQTVWGACSETSDHYIRDIATELKLFNFCHLNNDTLISFDKFLNWMYSKGIPLIRPAIEPLEIESQSWESMESQDYHVHIQGFPITLIRGWKQEFFFVDLYTPRPTIPSYSEDDPIFFLGSEGRDCLVIIRQTPQAPTYTTDIDDPSLLRFDLVPMYPSSN